MARKFGVKVCIHAGGVGLCNMAAHIAILDFVAISKSTCSVQHQCKNG
jgi:L-fuconate dehydratase